jgi:formylglycine-generating enzyme required for sulfatase activity
LDRSRFGAILLGTSRRHGRRIQASIAGRLGLAADPRGPTPWHRRPEGGLDRDGTTAAAHAWPIHRRRSSQDGVDPWAKDGDERAMQSELRSASPWRRKLIGVLTLFGLSWFDPLGAAEEALDAPESESLSIQIASHAAYRSGETELVAVFRGRPLGRYSWHVDGGFLDRDDRREVTWTTPDRRGKARVRLQAWPIGAADEEPLTAEREIELREPDREGFVRIPGGVYTLGDTWTDLSDPGFVSTNQNMADRPSHRVRLRPYYIARNRVTNAAYAAFLDRLLELGLVEITRHSVLGRHRGALVPFFRFDYDDFPMATYVPTLRHALRYEGGRFRPRTGEERHPVVDVTWAGAHAYALFHGHRLPTNAEWEAAARGTDGRRFPWGDEPPTPLHGGLNGYHGDRLFPVGTFSPLGDSPYGVEEMLGSVFEWVHDWYGETYYADIARADPIDDPTGPHWGKDHVVRGTGYGDGALGAREDQPPLSFRYAWFFEFPFGEGLAIGNTGFRTACDDFAWRDRRAVEVELPSLRAVKDETSTGPARVPHERGEDPGDYRPGSHRRPRSQRPPAPRDSSAANGGAQDSAGR